jgi:hypothetical protein
LELTWCASLGSIAGVEYTCQQLLACTKRQINGMDRKGRSAAWSPTLAKVMEGFRMLKRPFDDEATHFQKG